MPHYSQLTIEYTNKHGDIIDAMATLLTISLGALNFRHAAMLCIPHGIKNICILLSKFK